MIKEKERNKIGTWKLTAIILLVYKICSSCALIMQHEKGSKKKVKNE